MKRLILTFIAVTLAEFYAFYIFRTHPIQRPAYFPALLTAIQFWMSYGGIEAARWLLRKSPVSRAPGPESDWTRLWLWIGPPGGILMIITSVLAWRASTQGPSWIPPAILLAHAAGGGLLWLCASLEMLPNLARLHPASRPFCGVLAATGLLTHLLGLYFYVKFYPAGQLQVGLFILAILLTYFIFYYIWTACLIWMLVFRFWTPPTSSDTSADGSHKQSG